MDDVTVKNKIVNALTPAFKKMFPQYAHLAGTEQVNNWLSESIVAIVEYEGYLPKETEKQRTGRMKTISVYEGEFKDIGQRLRNTYPDTRNLTPQELILRTYDRILSIKDMIDEEQATPTNAETKSQEVSQDSNSDNVNVVSEVAEEPVQPVIDSATTTVSRKEDNAAPAPVEVKPAESEVKSDNEIQFPKEENKMAEQNVNDLIAATKGGAAAAINQMTGGATPQSNASISQEQIEASKAEVMEILKGSQAERLAYTKSNTIDQLIITKKPAALRTLKNSGTIRTTKKDETIATKIADKLTAFARATSGDPNITIDAWRNLNDEAKQYAAVIRQDNKAAKKAADNNKTLEGPTNLAKAKQVFALLDGDMLNAQPTDEFAAYIDKDHLSYTWVGAMVGGTPNSKDDLLVTIMDYSTGALLGTGSPVEKPATGRDTRVLLKIRTALVSNSSKNTGMNKKSNAQPPFTLSLTNKKTFLEDASHIVYMMDTKSDKDEVASFRALISVDGKECSASFSYEGAKTEKDANGNTKVATDANGNTIFVTKQFSVPVSVPVSGVEKKLAPMFNKDMTELYEIATYWGLKGLVPKTQKDPINITDMSGTDLTKALAAFYSSDNKSDQVAALQKRSNVLSQLINMRNKDIAERAAEDAAQLDQ